MKHPVILLVIVFAVIAAAVWVYPDRPTKPVNKEVPEGWITFTNEDFNFTFHYPPVALVDIVQPAVPHEPARVRVRLIGPKSEEGTEITDGFTFYVRTINTGKQATLKKVSQHVFNKVAQQENVLDTLYKGPDIGSRAAYCFSIRTKLGSELRYAVVEGNGRTAFVTSAAVAYPNSQERTYIDMIDAMIQSLEVISDNN